MKEQKSLTIRCGHDYLEARMESLFSFPVGSCIGTNCLKIED
jgi:hypothetical protein